MTIVVLTPEQLQEIVSRAVQEGVHKATQAKTLNATEFAGQLGISVRTLSRRVTDGMIPSPGPMGRWSVRDVNVCIEQQQQKMYALRNRAQNGPKKPI